MTSKLSFFRLLFGRTLANREQSERRIGTLEGIPAMGLDGLSSSAYGPEAAMTILIPLGAAGLAYIGPIMALIVALLLILFASYWQTIRAYPTNGGSYTVSKENLGTNVSLLAAAALMIDYVLNVAVGISAGVGALVSVVPSLQSYTLWLCIVTLVFITIVNLRGTQDEGRLFALPTYLFVASFVAIIAIGTLRAAMSGGHPAAVIPPPPMSGATEAVSLWLLLRAFASGCTAMTGVEAVSNGVDAFKEPVIDNAHRTLTAIVVILGLLLAGIAFLAHVYGLHSMDQTRRGYQSVLSQLVGAVAGHGVFFYVAMASVLAVLALSANTSFVGFPRICRLLAQDGFLPRPFALVGRRLVYSVGILYLAVTAGILLIVFGGITDRLIPLYAIGAFLTFTLSQTGMVAHWRKVLGGGVDWRARLKTRAFLGINALGAFSTAIALLVIIVAKFVEGAWITILVIPIVIVLLKSIRRYYERIDAALGDERPIDLANVEAPVAVVITRAWNKSTDRALGFALRVSKDVVAVHLTELQGPDEDDTQAMRAEWAKQVEEPARAAGLKPPPLLCIRSEFRLVHEPLLALIKELKEQFPHRSIAVLIPEFIITRWWQYFLHSWRVRTLRTRLLRYGGSRLLIVEVPWYMDEPNIEEGMEEGAAVQPAH